MTIDNIFYVVLSIVSILITGVLIPLLTKKYGREKLQDTMAIIEIAVKSAEQIYNYVGSGKDKKEYVINFVRARGIKVSDEQLDAMIEATVKELNLWQEQIRG